MPKNFHEIRDPIHVFIRLDTDERRVLDSRPFQRLRNIHQLALTYLVYPAATHKRFEHSLGVMELASRVFDIVTAPDNVTDGIRKAIPQISHKDALGYWRRALRMAALCHDMGHLPFSHAAEDKLLPQGETHESITKEIICHPGMCEIWQEMTPPLRETDIVKLALGPKHAKDKFNNWERILSEIIVGDAFGVDRMDYLLRDSHHIGVAYGRFDHHRLIDTLRILPAADSKNENSKTLQVAERNQKKIVTDPKLGVEAGGLQSAEALLLARYFMFSQVYYHPVRRAYDLHLIDFLQEWLPSKKFGSDYERHLDVEDNIVNAALLKAANDPGSAGHAAARIIIRREHFKVLWQSNPDDIKINHEAGRLIFDAACVRFGAENIKHDRIPPKGSSPDFPVLERNGGTASSLALSDTLARLSVAKAEYVFISRNKFEEAAAWLDNERVNIIVPKETEE